MPNIQSKLAGYRPGGLLGYMNRVETEEYVRQSNLRIEEQREERAVERQERAFDEALRERRAEEALRKRKREEQRRSRARKRDREIELGERSPGGTKKRQIIELSSSDSSESDSAPQHTLVVPGHKAELSRPDRNPAGKDDAPLAQNMNWFSPFIWAQIEMARKHEGWHPRLIEKRLKATNPGTFAGSPAIHHGTIARWIRPDGSGWTEKALERINMGSKQIYNATGQAGVLGGCIDTVEKIKIQLLQLRAAGIALTAHLCQGIIIAHLAEDHPETFTRIVRRTGQPFSVSLDFVRRFLHQQLNWSIRQATKAAQKVPADFRQQCYQLCLRIAWLIKHYNIPADCIVNSDQMQLQLQYGGSVTYAERNSKQVAVLGKEEKRACTVFTGLSMGGELLPFQSIWDGGKAGTNRCIPFAGRPERSPHMREAIDAGHLFTLSIGTYWSSMPTMKQYVNDLLVPHFHHQNTRHGRHPEARCIWVIDCWAIHRSEAFRTWMRTNYPWIFLQFIPGGCTGVTQPADTGMQRPLKNVIRKEALNDVVEETREKLKSGIPADELKADITLGTMRNRTVRWLNKAHAKCNTPEHVLKAWKLCHSGVDNMILSYDCLTSPETHHLLDDLPYQNEELFRQILPRGGIHDLALQGVHFPEDDEAERGIDDLDIILDQEELGNGEHDDDDEADLILQP